MPSCGWGGCEGMRAPMSSAAADDTWTRLMDLLRALARLESRALIRSEKQKQILRLRLPHGRISSAGPQTRSAQDDTSFEREDRRGSALRKSRLNRQMKMATPNESGHF